MSCLPDWGVYSVQGTPVTATSGAASATIALPLAADGGRARFVRVVATGPVWVLPVVGVGGTVAAGSGILLNTNDIVLNVRGFSHLAYIQQTAAQSVNIVPMDV